MVKISQINLGRVDYTKTPETTRIPKTTVQTFNTENNKTTDYTTVVKEHKYTAQIAELKTKYHEIEPEQYIIEAETNGFKNLVVSDSDYNEFGAEWDKLAS